MSSMTFYCAATSKFDAAIDDVVVSSSKSESLPYPYTGGPFIVLDENNISAPSACLQPMNIPYQRLNEGLEQIREVVYESGYELWEWWIDDETGEIYFGARKGSDKSGTVKFLATFHLGETSKDESTKETVQRLKLTGGKASTKGQDEVTSNWQVDTDKIDELGSFYEEIVDDKMAATRDTANELAKIKLAQMKDEVQEIEATILQDANPSGSWDVGDDVTIADSKSNIDEASYRIKKAHFHIDGNGENIDVTVTNAWEDVTDVIAVLFKKLRQIQTSNVGLEDWTAGGVDQNDVTQDKLEDQWEIKKRYDSSSELQEVDNITTSDSYGQVGDGLNGRYNTLKKDSLAIGGRTDAAAGLNTVYSTTRQVSWNRNPRFMVDFQVTEDLTTTDDYIQLYIAEQSLFEDLFGFRFTRTVGGYDVDCIARFGNSEIQRSLGNLDVTEVHTYEAKVNWKDRLILYYIDEVPKAVISVRDIDLTEGAVDPTAEMDVMWVNMNSTGTGGGNQSQFVCHYWKTQALKPQAAIED